MAVCMPYNIGKNMFTSWHAPARVSPGARLYPPNVSDERVLFTSVPRVSCIHNVLLSIHQLVFFTTYMVVYCKQVHCRVLA
jgi:hypothetical protein